MRNVVTTDEISHLWAHQTQESARATSAMSFHGPNFKSYNEVIAGIAINRTGQKAFLVTAHTFSVTTSRHLSNVRESIPYGAKVFFVDKPEVSTREYVPVPDGKKYDAKKHGWMDKKDGHTANHAENLDYWRRRITRLLVEAGEARREVKRTRLMGEAAADLATMHEYVDFFGVKGVKYPVVASTPEELSEFIAKKTKADAAEVKKAEKARLAAEEERRSRYADRFAAWLAGEDVSTHGWSDAFATALRIAEDEVQTSRGASFPLKDAKRGLVLVDAVVASGEPWQKNGVRCRLGHFEIDHIDKDGTVYAGCHVVPFESIARIREAVISA